jgi:hypothetical protein
MDQNRLRKLAGLNEAREELKEETNASLIKDLENNSVRQMKLLETKLGKVLRAASVIGAELAVIKLGLDATTDALADGEIGSSREAIKFMVKHAKNTVDENEEFFVETFGDEFRFLVEGLVEGEKVKPKV